MALTAGVGQGGPFVETDLIDELESIAINVSSTVHLASACYRPWSPGKASRR